MRVATRRIVCQTCGASTQEPISFCSNPYVRHTKWAARFALVLRADMSIKATAERTGMHWETIKNIEKAWLAKKYRQVHREVLPDADIVYDHFHVIKLMNERMNNLRRSTMNKLEDEQKKELKGKRFLLLRNEESLSSEAADDLKKLRFEFKDLGTASMMKEYLRNIYKLADTYDLARTAFLLWAEKAEASGIPIHEKKPLKNQQFSLWRTHKSGEHAEAWTTYRFSLFSLFVVQPLGCLWS